MKTGEPGEGLGISPIAGDGYAAEVETPHCLGTLIISKTTRSRSTCSYQVMLILTPA